ncbi:hypothetical protein FB45DRAFT_114589 [Roridomyces roridus]|uniref:Uncharacterized protein n=1 Tax=Roridomyces roridus TaxID=1738132 RepID=A0AAD7FH19_9AGAR|nr:hypothetical protein FB45DRAFT_114589 [Roridomyces roridus]
MNKVYVGNLSWNFAEPPTEPTSPCVARRVRFADNCEFSGNRSESEIYSRLFLSKGIGCPVYRPKPCDDLPEAAKRNGTAIGDVGIVTYDGCFDPIFNITLPPGDPLNRFGVPRDFSQLKIEPEDMQTKPMYYPPGTIISRTVKDVKHSSESENNPTNIINATAFLMLPDGASNWDLHAHPQSLFREYAIKHAQNWYQFVNGDLQRMVGFGDLYLVTGATKSTSWGIAVTDNTSSEEKVSLNFGSAESIAETKYWESSNCAFDTGPRRSPGEETWKDNQTVFIRGFRVAVRPPVCEDEQDSDDEEWLEDGGFCKVDLLNRTICFLTRLFFQHYHPSDDINQYILQSNLSTSVAVTHDNEWTCLCDPVRVLNCSDALLTHPRRTVQTPGHVQAHSPVNDTICGVSGLLYSGPCLWNSPFFADHIYPQRQLE